MSVAVVTGGGSGIGFAAIQALAMRGVDVRCWDVASNTDGQPPSAASTRSRRVDVADPDQIGEAFAELDREGVELDVLATCAGIFESAAFDELTAQTWERTMAVNLRGAVLCAVEATKRMRNSGGGRIVFVSSVAARASEPGSCAYSASKAALTAVTRSVAVDASRFGVIANAVAPGWVSTGMTRDFLDSASEGAFDRVMPLARVAEPSEIADVITYLSLDAPPYLTGATLVVDGGQLALAAVPE